MTDGLTEEDRSGIRAVLKANPKVRRAVLFGSRAMGTFRGASDVDLALEGEDINLKDLIAIKAQIEKSSLPIEVDLVIRAQIDNPDLEKHIRAYGREWFRRGADESAKWNETTLAQVMDIKHGFAFPGEHIRDEPPGDVLLTPGNFAIGGGFKGDKFKYFAGEVPDDYVLNEGDLVVTMTDLSKQADTLGYPALVPKPHGLRFLHNQRVGKILIKRGAELEKSFLFYLLRTTEYRNEVLASATGTTVKHTSPGRILAHKAAIPPLAEQKAIASVLGALDDKIELNRRMNATLEAMAMVLFQSWFVDFDPVRAKLDGRQPTGLDGATAALFPSSFHESKLGHIPVGWEVGRLGDLCNLKRGHDLPTSTRTPGSIPVISSSGITGTHTETNVRGPGVVTGRYGTIGKVFYVETDYWPLNTTLYVENFRGNPPRFIFHALGEVDFSDYTDKAAVPGVNRNHLHEEPTVLPPMEVRQAFAQIVEPLWSQNAANERQSHTLATLRDALLPKLLSGELRANEMKASV